MVLAGRWTEALPALQTTLAERFYAPRGLAPALTISTPVRGSGLIRPRG